MPTIIAPLPSQPITYSSPEPLPPPGEFSVETGESANPIPPQTQPRGPARRPLAWDFLSIEPGFLFRYVYATGLEAAPGNEVRSSIYLYAPRIEAGLDGHWTLEYDPTWTFYTNPLFKDHFDQAVSLTGRAVYQDVSLHFNQSYVTSSAPLVETGQQTDQTTATTSLNLTYSPGSTFLIDSNFRLDIRTADTFPGQREWSSENWVHEQFAPELDGAAGVTLGYVQVNPGANMDYLRPQARLSWHHFDKLSVQLQGGFERRWFDSARHPALQKPVYGLNLNYRPTSLTHFFLDVDRTIATSLFGNQVYANTQGSLRLEQRILGHFRVSAVAARNQANYISSASTEKTRSDRTTSYDLRVETTVRGRINVAVFFRRTKNTSSDTPLSFASNQFGGDLEYTF